MHCGSEWKFIPGSVRAGYRSGLQLRRLKEIRFIDQNRIEGTKREIKGATKQLIGNLTGNKGKKITGRIEKNLGKVQDAIGKTADKIRPSTTNKKS